VRVLGMSTQFLRNIGNHQEDLFERIQPESYGRFSRKKIADLAVFNSEGKVYPREVTLTNIFAERGKGRAIPVIVGPRPKPIQILQSTGEAEEVGISTESQFEEISRKEAPSVFVDSDDCRVTEFQFLKENKTYHYLKPKQVKVLIKGDVEKREVFKCQNDFKQFITFDSPKGLFSDDTDSGIQKFSQLIEGKVYYAGKVKPKQIQIVSFPECRNAEFRDIKTFYGTKDFKEFLVSRGYTGLVDERNRKKFVSFEAMIPDKTYFAIENFSGAEWISKSKRTIQGSALAGFKAEIENYLKGQNLDTTIEDKTSQFSSRNHKIVSSFDGVFYVPAIDSVFLLDCRLTMRRCYLADIKKRVKTIMDMLKSAAVSKTDRNIGKHRLKSSYKKVYGIACGDVFSPELREEAEFLGLLVMTPHTEGWEFNKKVLFLDS
jgi:hypothetical protein